MAFCDWLLPLSILFSGFIHVAACISTSMSFIVYYYSIVWIYYILFHLLMAVYVVSIFWLLIIFLLWMFMYKFLCRLMFSFLLGNYLGMKLLDHRVTLCLAFWGTARLFPKQLQYFTLSLEGSDFSINSAVLVIVRLSDGQSSGFEVISHCGFGLHFPNE